MSKLLCIVPDNLEALTAKGVDSHILQRDLNGYWDRVYTVHPFCKKDAVYELSDKHVVLEFRAFRLHIITSLIRLIKKERITAIKAHDPHFTGPLAWLLSRVCKIPYVVMICSSYDLMEQTYGRVQLQLKWLDNAVARFVMTRANMVFGGSGDALRWALEHGAIQDRATIVRTGGVDKCHFVEPKERQSLREEYNLAGKKVMLYVGRLDAIKYPIDVMRAAGIVRNVVKKSVLVVVGEGPMKAEIVSISPSGTIFLDFVRSQQRLASIMSMADVVMAPLSGSALVECALAARPIVAYDVDWHRELIVDGETGILVPFRDYIAMSRSVIDILRDGDGAKVLGDNARKAALVQHDLSGLYKKEAACFDYVLGVWNG